MSIRKKMETEGGGLKTHYGFLLLPTSELGAQRIAAVECWVTKQLEPNFLHVNCS